MSNWQQVVGYYSFLYTTWETTPVIMEAWPNSKTSHPAQLWSQYQAKAMQCLQSFNLNCDCVKAVCSKLFTSIPLYLLLVAAKWQKFSLYCWTFRLNLQAFTQCTASFIQILWNNMQPCTSTAVPLQSSRACVKLFHHLFPLLLPSPISTSAEISVLISYSCV